MSSKSCRQIARKAALAAVFLVCQTSLNSPPPALAKSFAFNDVANYPANPFKATAATPFTALTQRFINDTTSKSDWVGGDAAYSIPLSSKRTLWLFGDSFIGQVKNNKRTNCTMVHNALAIEDFNQSSPGRFKYFSGIKPVNPKSETTGFFQCRDKGEYYWPADGFLNNGKLYIFLHVVRTNNKLAVPFQFELRSDHLAIVDNPQDSPEKWRYQIQALSNSAKRTLFGVACRADNKHIYVFCSNGAVALDLFKNPAVVARLPLTKVQPFSLNKLEWWSQKWEPTYELPETLFDDGASEMTVTTVPGLSGYFAFYIPPDKQAIFMRHATEMQGPWSERTVVYQFPPTKPSTPDLLYYSAKAHPQYLKDGQKNKGQMILTYCTNSRNFAKLTSNAKLYVPQALKISLTNSISRK